MPVESKDTETELLRVKISKIEFPEFCPVCMEPAEDLVFISVTESKGLESYELKSWMRRSDKASAALEAAKGVTTFAVPTCMQHGSKSVRTIKTRIISAFGFFVFFYPILFFLLQINLALVYSRSLMEPLTGALISIIAMILVILYGLFPRALERSLIFENVKRVKDSVDLKLRNDEYRRLFLEMNEIYMGTIHD